MTQNMAEYLAMVEVFFANSRLKLLAKFGSISDDKTLPKRITAASQTPPA